jgi:hypothetical protein
MGSICKFSLNVVKPQEPKTLTGSPPKWYVVGTGAVFFPVTDKSTTGGIEKHLTHPVTPIEHGKPVVLPSG